MILDIFLYILGGCAAGFLAGLLGIGGGLLVVPFLSIMLPFAAGVPDAYAMHMAVATSLTIIVGTSLSSILAHHRHGGILWDLFKKLLLGIIVGAIIAGHIADSLSSGVLRIVFGLFVLFLSFTMVFKSKRVRLEQRELPGKVGLFFSSLGISGFCNILGMGGGSLMVPFLSRYQIPMRNAVATSAVCGFPIALVGVISLISVGADEPGLPAWSTGYVYWPAFICMVIPSIFLAPVGAKLAHRLPAENLKHVFAVFLLIVGMDMLSKATYEVWHWAIDNFGAMPFFYPHIDPVALAIGPLQIHWYGVMYLVGFVGAWGVACLRCRNGDRGWNTTQISDLLYYVALGVILGGRVGYMIFYDFMNFITHPLIIFKVWDGGMSFHGGLLGVMLAMWLYARNNARVFGDVMDFIAPYVTIGLGAGRIGNFINGELWGKPTQHDWGMIFSHVDAVPRHPSQLYEFLLEGVALFTILWFYSAKPKPRWAVSGMFALFYGIFRFSVEFVREPDIQYGYLAFGWLTMGQILSLPLIIVGIALIIFAYKRKRYAAIS